MPMVAPETLRILSLGAGVQSSTLALMIERGEVEAVSCAIFSDVGAEPAAVYEWLDWLKGQLSYPVHIVKEADGLTAQIEKSVGPGGSRFAGAPFYAHTKAFRKYKGKMIQISESEGMLRRQCTKEFKIVPIERKIREILGVRKGKHIPKGTLVESLQGITVDEIQRMKVNPSKWNSNVYPLVDLRMSRHDCLLWMERNGYPKPPRSACVYCPYRTNDEWRRLKADDPGGWTEAVRVDALIRSGVRGTTDPLYVHKTLKPLDEVDLSTDEDRGQMTFLGECDGMCNV